MMMEMVIVGMVVGDEENGDGGMIEENEKGEDADK